MSAADELARLEAVVRSPSTGLAERDEVLRAIAQLEERLIAEAPARCVRGDGASAFRVRNMRTGRAFEVCAWHLHQARGVLLGQLEVLLERDPDVAMWVAAADQAIEIARREYSEGVRS